MADDQISVELVAKIDGLQSGLSEASAAMREAADSMRSSMKSTEEAAEGTESKLGELTEAVKGFFEFEYIKEGIELLKEGLEQLHEAFEGTVVKAEEFGLSNAKFAAMMGVSETEAAGLSAALRGVGSSAQEYEQMAVRMEGRLTTNEKAMREMGLVTRDANGQLLNGKALMDSAIATMQTYKAGTDANSFAYEVFGRNAAQVHDIMRVNEEQVQRQIDIYAEFGVQTEGAAGDSVKLEDALNDLRTMADALEIKFGQQLMPAAQAALEWIGNEGAELAKELADGLVDLGRSIGEVVGSIAKAVGGLVDAAGRIKRPQGVMDWLNALDDITGNGSGGPIDSAIDKMQDMGTGADSASSAIGHLGDAWDKLMNGISGNGPGSKADIFGVGEKSLLSEGEGQSPETDPLLAMLKKGANPYGQGGSKKFVAPKTGKDKEDRGPEEAIAAAAKLAEAKLALEEQTNQHLLSMGQETIEQSLSNQRDYENESSAIKLSALYQELALPGRKKNEIQKTNEEILLLEQTHENALLKITQEGEKQRAALAKADLADFMQAEDGKLASGMESIKRLADAHEIGANEEYGQELALTQKIRDEELRRFDDEHAALTKGTQAYDDAMKERGKLVEKFTKDADKLEDERKAKIKANVTEVTTAMEGPFKQAIASMVDGTKTFGQSMAQMCASMAENFSQLIAKMVDDWAIGQITNAVNTATSGGAEISTHAGVAAAAAASSQAGIPIVGPVLAIAAATAMEGFVLGLGSLAHASGGMVVDHDQLAMVHRDEHILPAYLARGYTNIINSGGGASTSQGGDVNLHYAPTVNASTPDAHSMLREQSGTFIQHLNQWRRDGRI